MDRAALNSFVKESRCLNFKMWLDCCRRVYYWTERWQMGADTWMCWWNTDKQCWQSLKMLAFLVFEKTESFSLTLDWDVSVEPSWCENRHFNGLLESEARSKQYYIQHTQHSVSVGTVYKWDRTKHWAHLHYRWSNLFVHLLIFMLLGYKTHHHTTPYYIRQRSVGVRPCHFSITQRVLCTCKRLRATSS